MIPSASRVAARHLAATSRLAGKVSPAVVSKLDKLIRERRFPGWQQIDDPWAQSQSGGTYGRRTEGLPKFYVVSPSSYTAPWERKDLDTLMEVGALLGPNGEANVGNITVRREDYKSKPGFNVVVQVNTSRLGSSDTMAARAHLQGLLGLFHAVYWLHWTTHWQTNGDPFYGDHQLFAKLYEAMPAEIDALAEKLVQMYGREAVAVEHHLPVMGRWISGWSDPNPVGRALAAERELQAALKRTYDVLKETGTISLGLDDFLMSVANDHESHLYLLQQRMGGVMSLEGKVASGAPSAEEHFFDRPRAREVREFAESKAITNDRTVAEGAIKSKELSESPRKVRREVDRTPPTVAEVVEMPGGGVFSTLNRYVVDTEHPTDVLEPRPHPRILSR